MQGDPSSLPGVFAALGAGIVSFLSPCVLPLVPGYLSAVTGVSVAELDDVSWRKVLAPSLIFVGSFLALFILLGLTATGLGQTLNQHKALLETIAGIMIIVLGVYFVASLFIVRLNKEWHVEALMARAGKGGPVVAGAAFAIAWTPCIGPTLGAILTAASVSGTAAHGALLLAFYSAGLGIPFLVIFSSIFGALKYLLHPFHLARRTKSLHAPQQFCRVVRHQHQLAMLRADEALVAHMVQER